MKLLVIEISGSSDKERIDLANNIALSLKEQGYDVHHEDSGWEKQKKTQVNNEHAQIIMYRNLFD